ARRFYVLERRSRHFVMKWLALDLHARRRCMPNELRKDVHEKSVNAINVICQKWVRLHLREQVTVVHTVQRVELNRVPLEVTPQECLARTVVRLLTLALHVIEENGEVWSRYAGEPIVYKLVNKDLVNTVLTGGFHRTDGLQLPLDL